MKHPLPERPELGERDGLAYALFLPEERPAAGVVILHGAGSAKESHFDFGRVARARGLAALAYDARGHGRSGGEFGPGCIDDALAMCALLREHAPAVALRGSSLGGFCAILAAAAAGRSPRWPRSAPRRRTGCCAGCAAAGSTASGPTAPPSSRGSRGCAYATPRQR